MPICTFAHLHNCANVQNRALSEAQEEQEESGEDEGGDPSEVAVEGAADGKLVAADGAAVFVGGDFDGAAGAFAGAEVGLGIDLHGRVFVLLVCATIPHRRCKSTIHFALRRQRRENPELPRCGKSFP
jgi:hypothetical protein